MPSLIVILFFKADLGVVKLSSFGGEAAQSCRIAVLRTWLWRRPAISCCEVASLTVPTKALLPTFHASRCGWLPSSLADRRLRTSALRLVGCHVLFSYRVLAWRDLLPFPGSPRKLENSSFEAWAGCCDPGLSSG